jgi:hypothetical protein
MVFSISAINWLLGTIALAFLTLRLWKYYKAVKGEVAKIFVLITFFVTLNFFINFIGRVFLVQEPTLLTWLLIIANFIGALGLSLGAYLIFLIQIPQLSPKIGFSIVIFLIIIDTILFILYPPSPQLLPEGIIEWNFQLLPALLFSLILVGVAFPLGIILIRTAPTVSEAAKTKALGLGSLLLVFSFFIVLVFILESRARLIVEFFLGLFIFWIAIFTQKPPHSPYVKQI